MLYIVPTPVGNLSDMTYRGVETLRNVELILAEDTRTSAVLLKHYDINTPCRSFHKFNEHKVLDSVMERLEGGADIALISDAGTPGISDPGFMLARECKRRGVALTCLPGATALIPALVSSGLPTDRFVFEGFLPLKKGLATRLEQLAQEERTVEIYESPHRLLKTLQKLGEAFGKERQGAVCRELSKVHETIHTGTLKELADHFCVNQPKGESVIVIAGKEKKKKHSFPGPAEAPEAPEQRETNK